MGRRFQHILVQFKPHRPHFIVILQRAGKAKSHVLDTKAVVKLFLRHPLHAKLYLLFRPDPINSIVIFLGSSNIAFAGLSQQGELNVDILDQDACEKLAKWFKDRWDDRWCIDISTGLGEIIGESWAREAVRPPYHIYLKMVYHLSQEARAGLSEFRIPRDLGNQLFEFQKAAVNIAAHHLNKRRGVLIGDVVGLGKTLMATAVARNFEDDHDIETLPVRRRTKKLCGGIRTRLRNVDAPAGRSRSLHIPDCPPWSDRRPRGGSAPRRIKNEGNQDIIKYQEFYPKSAKDVLDKIDAAMGDHYGLSAEELDFVTNYDIKYRLGQVEDIKDE